MTSGLVPLHRLLASGAALSLVLMATPGADAKVGVAAAVNTDARGRPPGAAPRVITIGQNVVFNEEIVTDGAGLVQILLLDGTTFTVGPGSQLTIDEFVYDPNTGDAKVVASVTKGALRFIGGQTSRKEGGATIKTPVGTIGIRGAMAEISVASDRDALFSMVFGDSLDFTGRNGKAARIYRPGYTLEVKGGPGGTSTKTRPRTQADAKTFQTALAGQPGKSGGAKSVPTNAIVASSPVTAVVSNLPQTMSVLPSYRPTSPVQSTDADGVVDIGGELVADQSADIIREEVVEQEEEPPPPPPPDGNARVLTAPDVYQDIDGPLPAAGSRGLVGSTAESDFAADLVARNGQLVSDTQNISLPDLTGSQGDEGLERIEVLPGQASWNGRSLSGTAYAGAGDFAAYFLGIGGDPTQPFYTIMGTGTNLAALLASDPGDGVREYALTEDPIRPGRLPFFSQDLYGSTGNANVTNLLVVEPNDSDSGQLEALLTGLDISGEGSAQRSAVLVYAAGTSVDETGNASFGGSRRGSMRIRASDSAVSLRGGVSTLAGPDGSHLFGDNGENFVIGPIISEHFQDSALRFSETFTGDPLDGYLGDGGFGTHHVADLVSDVPQVSLSRTTRSQLGFASGLSESWSNAPGETAVLGSLIPDFELDLDATEHTATAFAFPVEMFNNDPVLWGYQIRFGEDEGGGRGNSTFVDDHRFGATQNNRNTNTRILTDGGQSLAEVEGRNAGSYMVSGRATPIPGFEHCPSCDFVDWGWWGTQVQVEGNGSAEVPETRRDMVHLGTWVAGQLTQVANLPTDIVATYEGTALGNVARTTDAGTFIYVAAGTFDLTYDFNARQGTVNLNDFDGMDAEVLVAQYDYQSVAAFQGGGLTGEGDVQVLVSGAFVDDGDDRAAGVIGEFGMDGEGLRIAGTLVGERTGSTPVGEVVRARVLTSADEFVIGGEAFSGAGERGLVGGTPETDRVLSLRADGGGPYIDSSTDTILPELFAYGETGLEVIYATSGWRGDGQSVSGPVYAGYGNFAAYMLSIDGIASQPWYAIIGSETPDTTIASLYSGTELRRYELMQDPLRPSVAPFFAEDLYGALSNYNVSDLYMLEGNDTGSIMVYESWIDISGSGVDQKSAASVFAGDVYEDEDYGYRMWVNRRGGFRASSTSGPARMGGAIQTLAGPEGGHFFGDDLQNFLLGGQLQPVDGYGDSGLQAGFTGDPDDGYLGNGYPFATHHVAGLVDKTDIAGLTRPTRELSGFMAGIGESTFGGIASPYALLSDNQSNLALSLDGNSHEVRSTAIVHDVLGQDDVVDNFLLTFGRNEVAWGASAYIDTDRYAATENRDPGSYRLRTDGGQNLPNLSGGGGYRPNSYIVSGRANPIPGYEHCTNCEFLDWGWWGTRVRIGASGAEVPNNRDDYVHMGTWVAGDITNPADLPTNISVNYSGTALGTVTRQTGDGVAKYIARGDMNMSFDFASRSGNMEISNFDGMSVNGLISENSSVREALFRGSLSGSGVNGAVQGAFVNNGPNVAAGVIGNFGLRGEGVSAAGTIAGARAP